MRRTVVGDIGRRRSEIVVTALAIWTPLLVVLGAALLVTSTTEVTVRQLTQDPTTVLDGPFYVGALSNLGNVLWAAAATVCLLTALALRSLIDAGWRRFMFVSGLFTAVLLLDDLFLVHDEILPRYAGISGELYGIAYVVGMLAYLGGFRHRIAQTNWPILLAALVCFGISTVVDLGSSRLSEMAAPSIVILVEDGTKLLGIGTWLAYFVSVSRQAIVSGPLFQTA
ncbi:MAG: hypothetical protein ACRDG7_11840 [Candidatus Limnocylindria bacterium]